MEIVSVKPRRTSGGARNIVDRNLARGIVDKAAGTADFLASTTHGFAMFPFHLGSEAIGYALGGVLPGYSGKELAEKYGGAVESVTLQPGMISAALTGGAIKPEESFAQQPAELLTKGFEFFVPTRQMQEDLARMKELGVPEGVADQAAFWLSKFTELLAFKGYHTIGSGTLKKLNSIRDTLSKEKVSADEVSADEVKSVANELRSLTEKEEKGMTPEQRREYNQKIVNSAEGISRGFEPRGWTGPEQVPPEVIRPAPRMDAPMGEIRGVDPNLVGRLLSGESRPAVGPGTMRFGPESTPVRTSRAPSTPEAPRPASTIETVRLKTTERRVGPESTPVRETTIEPPPLTRRGMEEVERTNLEGQAHAMRQRTLSAMLEEGRPKDARKTRERTAEESKPVGEEGQVETPEGREPIGGERPVRVRDVKEDRVAPEPVKEEAKPIEELTPESPKEEINRAYEEAGKVEAVYPDVEAARANSETLLKGQFKTLAAAAKKQGELLVDPTFVAGKAIPEIIKVGDKYRLVLNDYGITPEIEAIVKRELSSPRAIPTKEAVEASLREAVGEYFEQGPEGVRVKDGVNLDAAIKRINDITDQLPLAESVRNIAETGDRMVAKLMEVRGQRQFGDPTVKVAMHPLEYKANRGMEVVYDSEGRPFDNMFRALEWMDEKGLKGRVEATPFEDGWFIELGEATREGIYSARDWIRSLKKDSRVAKILSNESGQIKAELFIDLIKIAENQLRKGFKPELKFFQREAFDNLRGLARLIGRLPDEALRLHTGARKADHGSAYAQPLNGRTFYTGIKDRTVMHELAHIWQNDKNLAEKELISKFRSMTEAAREAIFNVDVKIMPEEARPSPIHYYSPKELHAMLWANKLISGEGEISIKRFKEINEDLMRRALIESEARMIDLGKREGTKLEPDSFIKSIASTEELARIKRGETELTPEEYLHSKYSTYIEKIYYSKDRRSTAAKSAEVLSEIFDRIEKETIKDNLLDKPYREVTKKEREKIRFRHYVKNLLDNAREIAFNEKSYERLEKKPPDILEPRDWRDILRDVKELAKDERGSISLEKMAPEKLEIIRRLARDAARAGKKVAEFLIEAGYEARDARLIEEAAKQLDKQNGLREPVGSMKLRTGEDVSLTKPMKYKGVLIRKPPVYEGQREALKRANELTRLPGTRWGLETPLRTFRKAGKEIMDMIYYPYRAAEKVIHQEWLAEQRSLSKLEKGVKRSESKRIGRYAIAQQEGGLEILDAMKVKRHKIPTELTPREQRIYDNLRERFKSLFTRVNEMRVENGLRPMKEVDNYFTFFHTFGILERIGYAKPTKAGHVRPNLLFDSPEIIADTYAQMRQYPFRFVKARTKLGREMAIETDPFKIYRDYARTATRHIHMSPIIAKVKALRADLKDPSTKSGKYSLRRDKPLLDRFLLDWSNHLAGVRLVDPGGLTDIALRKLNSNLTFATLAGNARSALIQFSALRNSYVALGEKYTMQGILDIMDAREGFGKFKEAMKKSDVLTTRYSDEAIAAAMQDIKSGRLSGVPKTVGLAAFWPLQAFDIVTAAATWRGAYRMATEKFGISGKEAVKFADDVVVATQASSLTGDLAAIQRHSLGKFITKFQTFVINDFDFLANDVAGIKGNAVTKAKTSKIMRYVIGTMLLNMLYEDLLDIKSPYPRPVKTLQESVERDDERWRTALQVAKEFAEPMPIIGSVRYGSHPFGAGIDYVGQVGKTLSGDEEYAKVDKILELVGKGLGVPGTAQAVKSYRAAKRGEGVYGSIVGRYEEDTGGGKRR